MADTAEKAYDGDSKAQRAANAAILSSFSRSTGLNIEMRRIEMPGGSWLELGASPDKTLLCETWARVGAPGSAQKHKVLADAFKLLAVEQLLLSQGKPRARKVLVFGDETAAAFFRGRSWMAGALQSLGIEVVVSPMTSSDRQSVVAAQGKQFRQ